MEHFKLLKSFLVLVALLGAFYFMPEKKVGAILTVEEKLLNKTVKERANIKSLEIAKLNYKGSFIETKYGLTIEIESIEAIDGGIELYARAWKGGKQLGFGKDGSVEWERFKIYNPPILTEDVGGTIIRYLIVDRNQPLKEIKLKENPIKAIQESLAHTIFLVGKENSDIILGKRGNTTSTFYPDADPESTSVDGLVLRSSSADNLASIRSLAGTTALPSHAGAEVAGLYGSHNAFTELDITIFLYDTSSIPDTDEVSSAIMSVEGTSAADGLNTPAQSVVLTNSNPDSNTNITTADYTDHITEMSTELGTSRITCASWNTTGYNDFTIVNPNNVIQKISITKLGLRLSADFDNVSPTGGTTSRVNGKMADTVGTSSDPKLVVVHAEPAPSTGEEAPIWHLFMKELKTFALK